MSNKVNLRGLKIYKVMNLYTAVGIAEALPGFENSIRINQLAAWQWLHDTGEAYKLQGWFGRACQSLINDNLIRA